MNTLEHTGFQEQPFDPSWALVMLAGSCLFLLMQ
jgi:hypothetical protein